MPPSVLESRQSEDEDELADQLDLATLGFGIKAKLDAAKPHAQLYLATLGFGIKAKPSKWHIILFLHLATLGFGIKAKREA